MTLHSSWKLVAASVSGELHKLNNIPCQDSSGYYFTNNDFLIAAVSDGAGSAQNSAKGSKWLVENSINYFKDSIENYPTRNQNSMWSNDEWVDICNRFYTDTISKLKDFSLNEGIEFDSLASTLILTVKSKTKLFTLNIGDGRAGYRNDKAEWHPMIIPCKGEEVNSTIFFTSSFIGSSQDFIRTNIIEENVNAFCLLTDGLENICFEVNVYDAETEKYIDPNKPFKKFLDPCIEELKKLFLKNLPNDKIEKLWENFLIEGTELIKREPDDKTLILAFDLSQFE
ncbi:MAG: protein phosphatase 2C domain-containing protein [Ignavibacterium album]|jgi:serine/threonine protein phosphatase PrpC|uniref:PP2C family serine/threonine-protein phosphatase n=1 Tax=Ignavibacterium album TaxID=591197 RepID=UPI0026F29781|nr:PP2C family serine/threonine-protein phosphatase [Ignavibacterium album]MBI5662531.1 protein phosphatase 2C domain-containing protein [Ignavibacterium album]